MSNTTLRRIKALSRLGQNRILPQLGLILRAIFCLGAGVVVLLATSQEHYDTRFNLRGVQTNIKTSTVLVNLSRSDLMWMGQLSSQSSSNIIRSLKEIAETSDSFFWNPVLWEKALSKVFEGGAKQAAITLFFGEETIRGTLSLQQQAQLRKWPIYWAGRLDSDGRVTPPGMARPDGLNVGIAELKPDADGKIRRFWSASPQSPNLALRLAPKNEEAAGATINYIGPENSIKSITFSQVVKGNYPHGFFKNKTVIFGFKDVPAHMAQTPVGPMPKSELLAQVTTNLEQNLWIEESPFWVNVLYLFAILLLSLWLIYEYPPSVTFVFFGFISIGIVCISTAFFDLRNIWVPVEALLALILVTYVVVSGYRLGFTERMQWESEKELRYLSEVEALKNNFLSLISHDLKNPIAKVQAIIDRLLSESSASQLPSSVQSDLQLIRQTSDELRQYITSLLQLTRVEARDIKLTKESCDINAIVEAVLERVRPLATNKEIEIRTNLEPMFSLDLDRTLITEVILNLVENAVKYSRPKTWISVQTQEVGNQVRLEVEDIAGGIPENDIPRIFEKFYRGTQAAQSNRITGTGLGLYLVKYFIELHGGKVFIDTVPGVGTKIGFTLPLDSQEEYEPATLARSYRG